jgi:hypothetical protein
MALNLSLREAAHPFLMTDREVRSTFSDPLYVTLIESPRFQRLKHVRFLGTIDYLITANGTRLNIRHTRYQHSLGVGYLARRLSKEVGWGIPTERAFVAAALLHDIGHGPLSHSLEPVFHKSFAINHHDATLQIITSGFGGEAPLAESLAAHGVDSDRVIDMISNRAGEWVDLFLGPFNLDTLEAISRCATYLHRNPVSAPPWSLVLAAHIGATESPSLLDSFWALKDLVYTRLIQSPTGISADLNAQDFIYKHLATFNRDDFFLSEHDLRQRQPLLFKQFNAPRWDRVTIRQRRFEIRGEIENPRERYTERRQEVTFDYATRPWGHDFGDLAVDGWSEKQLRRRS